MKFISNLQTKLGKKENISSRFCSDTDLDKIFFLYESRVIHQSLKSEQTRKFECIDDMMYYRSQFMDKTQFKFADLDFIPFLDANKIVGHLPVVLFDSPILYSYIMMIHLTRIHHAGVDIIIKAVSNKMFVPEKLGAVVKKIRMDYSKCRIILKKTSELRMAEHPESLPILAPPFYHAMMDIAFNFSGKTHKRSRVSVKIYALVIVCIMTGTTNIFALEGLETVDVVQALERHASRHGIPVVIFVDNGTQLKTLSQAKFSLERADLQVQESMGMRIN